jgi:tetratricopeptide (TPR) repeat protein
MAVPASAQDATEPLSDAWLALRSGDYARAVEQAQIARKADDDEEAPWRVEAEALLRLGRYEDAFQLLAAAREEVPYSLRLRLLAREAALFCNREQAAAELLQELAYIANQTPRYLRNNDFLAAMGEAALLMGVEPRLVLENFLKPAQRDGSASSRDAFLAAGKLALEKDDYAVASRTFQEALKEFPDEPDFWWGMAASFVNGDRTKLVEYAVEALNQNPRHVPTRVLLAEHRIDTEDYAAAEVELASALAVNPRHAEAWALRSVIAQLQHRAVESDKFRAEALKSWSNNPGVDHLIGRKLSQKYWFAEGAQSQRRALQMNPKFSAARVQLAQDLLRLAKDEEGWAQARQAHTEDPYDVTAYNLTVLQDQLDKFTTLTSRHFRLRMSKKEALVYGERAMALLERAREQLMEKYGLQLDEQVTVEIYPDPKDFAVRTFGMPGRPGYLGVCFGPVFTVNSPATQRTNWESVLWHEFCHVITLTLTRNRMPRWLSEGISVYEERQASPNWGERMTPGYRKRILEGKMQPVSKMSAAFLQAESNEDVLFAYYQSSLVVEFIIERYGFAAIKNLLAALREGMEINAALAQHVAPLDALERDFVPFAQAAAKSLGRGFDVSPSDDGIAGAAARLNPRHLPTRLAEVQELIEEKKWAEAKAQLTDIVDKAGYVPGEPNAHSLLARVCGELGDLAGEKAAWTVVAEHEGDALGAVSRLLAIAQEQQDQPGTERWSHAWLAINPLAPTPWRALLDVSEKRKATQDAVSAAQVLLHLDAPDVAALHYRIARQLITADQRAARKHVLLALAEAPRYRAAYDLLEQLPSETRSP